MNESILLSIKNMLGIVADDNSFDDTLIVHINSVFSLLNQMGVGPEKSYYISDSNNKWTEFMINDSILNAVKTYVNLKVKLLFDPPLNSAILNSFQSQIKELEYRLYVESDNKGGDQNE